MRALHYERNVPRYLAARAASVFGAGRGAGVSPLRLVELDAPKLPGAQWYPVHPLLAGICGSDLATIDGRSSRYFEDIVSFPFVPGHEIVGTLSTEATLADGTTAHEGERVVIEPVLGCAARGITPMCTFCASGQKGRCEHLTHGHLRAGLQTGFCTDTGGGWSEAGLVAHSSQLHLVPDDLSDNDAVMVEPFACALHAALRTPLDDSMTVAIVGAGTLGLLTTAAICSLGERGLGPRPASVLVGARYAHQRELALSFGADRALPPDQLARGVRLATGSFALGSMERAGRLTGGADVVYDCVGSSASIQQSLSMVRPDGTIVLVGMPAKVSVDLVSLWQREIRLIGAYAYGTEQLRSGDRSTFSLALELAGSLELGRLVSAAYPLDRFEEALSHAGNAGPRGAVKICFTPSHRRGATKGISR